MAKYKASHTLQCWKQHRCAGCNSLYRYLFKRTNAVTASSPEKAQELLRKRTEKIAATSLDEHPCPQCGAYQPDMVAQHRRTRYVRYAWCAVGVLLIALIASASDGVQIPTTAAAAVALVGLFVALEAWAALRNFNGDLAGNRRTAEKAVAKGELRLDAPGGSGQPQFDLGGNRAGLGFVVLLGLSVLVLGLAEADRSVSHWPLNTDFYPPVAGPGDKTRFYMPESIISLKNYWRGKPSAELANAGEIGLVNGTLPATTNESAWSGTISVKSSEKNTSSRPWIAVTLPDDAALANKVAKLRLKLAVEFPHMAAGNTYDTARRDFTASPDLRLATPGAGKTYQTLWYGGLAGSLGLLAVATFLLCRQASRDQRNTQTGLLPLDQPGTPPPMPGVR